MAKKTACQLFWIAILTAVFAAVSAGAVSGTHSGTNGPKPARVETKSQGPEMTYAELSCALAGPFGC